MKDFVLFVYWKNQQEVIVCYYSYATDSLTTTTTFTTTIYLLLMALETRGLLQLLSRYNSKKVQYMRNIHILHLLQLLLLLIHPLLRHTTDDTKLGVTVPLFSMSFHRYNNPFYYNNPGLEKHQDRGFLLIISRYNFKNAKVNVHIPHLIQ